MFHITDCPEGFRIFQPAAEMFETYQELKRNMDRRNRAFLNRNPRMEFPGKISGTFVYAHAPDYASGMMQASAADWKARLAPLCAAGIDTVILQAAVWKELQECYYPSRNFRHFRCWNVIDPLLQAAAELPLTVYLGEYGAVASWQQCDGSPEAFAAETECHLLCLEELFQRYRGGFHGIYFTSESGYPGHRAPEREAAMGRLYRTLFGKVRELDPRLPIMISPVNFYHAGKSEEMIDFWCTVFADAAPDILAPQDSIGTMCAALEDQRELYAVWDEIARRKAAQLWANIELFAIEFPAPGISRLVPAEEDRVQAQIAAATPLAQKLICWEALAFPLPQPAVQPV